MYDEDGSPTNEGVLRSVAHLNGVLHGASHTYLYKWEDGELYVLLQRRSLNKDSFPGCLDSSSAGHVGFGSNFMETAQKELNEELGITVDADRLEKLFTQRIHSESVFHQRPFKDNEINVVYALEMDGDMPQFELQSSEVSEVVLIKADRVLEMLNSSSEICINREEAEAVVETLKRKHITDKKIKRKKTEKWQCLKLATTLWSQRE